MKPSCLLSAIAACLLNFAVLAENWPQFRGPTGQGISTETGLPTTWSTNSGIAWKTPIPGEPSWSSPIVWGDRVFLTSTTNAGKSLHLLCLNVADGKLLWNKQLLQQDPVRKEDANSWATSTPVTDGQLVYVVSFNGAFVAVDFNGAIRWANPLTTFYVKHGLASSPILHDKLIIMNCDGTIKDGTDPYIGWQKPWDKSFVIALDKSTGKIQWKTLRGNSRVGFSTPIVVTWENRRVVLTTAGDVVQGLDLETGERIWTATNRGEGVVPSPAFGENIVFSPSAWNTGTPEIPEAIRAFRLGGKGDVSKSHLVWEQTQNSPRVPSLLYAEPYLYSLHEGGMFQCLKAATGEIVWKQRIDSGPFAASPLFADNRIYLLSEKGETTVLESGPSYKLIARNPLPEKCKGSIAVSGGRLFIRGQIHLYSIGK